MKNILTLKSFSVLFVIAMSIFNLDAQQESQYTQFMNNKLYYNPGFAGNQGVTSFTGLFRRQWIGFEGAPESKLLSASLPLAGERIGMGFLASIHELGVTRNWYLSMAYSYNIKIDENSNVRIGLHGTMRRLVLDFSKPELVIQDRLDNSILQGNESGDYYGNFGFGLYYNYKKFYAGFSIPNSVENNINLADGINLEKFASESRHFYLMAGMSFDLKPKITFEPNILFKYVNNAPFDVDLNFNFIYDNQITGGLSYRSGGDTGIESLDILAAYKIKQLTLGVSYDIPISSLGKETAGSIELIARFDLVKRLAAVRSEN